MVDSYSAWCGPCKAIVSSFKRLKNELGDDLLVFATVSIELFIIFHSIYYFYYDDDYYYYGLATATIPPLLLLFTVLSLHTKLCVYFMETIDPFHKWLPI